MQTCIMGAMSQITHVIQRLRTRLSQSEISRRTGIAQSKLSRWEAGNIAAGADDAIRLIDLDAAVAAEAAAAPAEPAKAEG